jgi:hypothetical protein
LFISYSKNNKKDAQDFKRLFEKKEPVIDGKEVVIWTMQQLLAGSSFNPIHRLNNTLAVAKCVHCLCQTFHLLC